MPQLAGGWIVLVNKVFPNVDLLCAQKKALNVLIQLVKNLYFPKILIANGRLLLILRLGVRILV